MVDPSGRPGAASCAAHPAPLAKATARPPGLGCRAQVVRRERSMPAAGISVSEAVFVRPTLPRYSWHAWRQPARRSGSHRLGFEPLEFRELLAAAPIAADDTRGPDAPRASVFAARQPAAWVNRIEQQTAAWLVSGFHAPMLTGSPTMPPTIPPFWPPTATPRGLRQPEGGGADSRFQRAERLPKPATAALLWPPPGDRLPPRPVRPSAGRLQILAPESAAAPAIQRPWPPAPRTLARGDRVGRVAVYSSASFNGLRGPHLRFRYRKPLPHEGR